MSLKVYPMHSGSLAVFMENQYTLSDIETPEFRIRIISTVRERIPLSG
jgi:hypothetical protein